MRYADLHTHTYHSDGTRSPREVVDVALDHRLEILAISDHDNLAAFYEIKPYADSRGMTLIPAMELSCAYQGVDVHVLAYAFNPHDERIDGRLRRFFGFAGSQAPQSPPISGTPAEPPDPRTVILMAPAPASG